MGSDRQSILLHENGKKHKERVEKHMIEQRKTKQKKEQNAKLIQQSLQQMESAAQQKTLQHDVGNFYHPTATPSAYPGTLPMGGYGPPVGVPSSTFGHPPPPPQSSSTPSDKTNERKDWESRKKQRQEENRRKRKNPDGEDEEEDDEANDILQSKQRRTIAPDEGHYTHGETTGGNETGSTATTYLEGQVFYGILEQDTPIQIWTGPTSASMAERKLVERNLYWKDGIVVNVRQKQVGQETTLESEADNLVCDIAYLKSADDQEETLEKSVSMDRIRIILGGDDDCLPETLEEARLLALGGEEIVVVPNGEEKKTKNEDDDGPSLEEATGLSSWSTVRIKRTTVRQELKEERARLRQQRRRAALEAERQKKLAEERKMEEAKVANADDSALGAYDVWSRTKDGYKGVDIHDDAADKDVKVQDILGKKLAEGKEKVGFKKKGSAFKSKKKKQNRRTTSADDD